MRVLRFAYDGENPLTLAGELRALAPSPAEVSAEVAEIVAAVRERGDAAVRELTARFDGSGQMPEELLVEPGECARALDALDPAVRDSLLLARDNIERVARAQLGPDREVELGQGQRVAIREVPVGEAGAYAPGGRATYPSSVLMCCVPARVAGVERVAVASPPGPDGRPHPAVLAACAIAGANEVFAMGGAQAIAAFAYGTDTVPPVDVVAGPGNRYVQEAKRQVAGSVGIDGVAGPSELVAILDRSADLGWAALDLCAQAEHGTDGLLAALAADRELLNELGERVERLAPERPSVRDALLALVDAPDLEAALELADTVAPEHLQLMCAGAGELAGRVSRAGCVFVGGRSATAFGDYVAGSNHVLPTGGAARFAGALGPATFRHRMSVVSVTPAAAAALAPHVARLARVEGFPVHGESAEARAKARTE